MYETLSQSEIFSLDLSKTSKQMKMIKGPRWRVLLLLAILLHSDHVLAQDNDDPAVEETNDKSAETSRTTSLFTKKSRAAVFNDSPFHLALYSVQEEEELVTPPTGVVPGGSFILRTATGEAFRVHELPHPKTGLCGDATSGPNEPCRSATFVIPKGLDPGTLVEVACSFF